MHSTNSRFPILAAGLLSMLFAAGCGSVTPTVATPATGGATPAVRTATPASRTATPGPGEPTPVPDGRTATAEPEPTRILTTSTGWGTILDAVPAGFPVYPGAAPAESVDGPASGVWQTDAGVDAVASWYRDALEQLGYTTDSLSSPLEDGSRVLDTVSDLPECRIQTTFRPAGGSTMIIVLYGAGCAGAGG